MCVSDPVVLAVHVNDTSPLNFDMDPWADTEIGWSFANMYMPSWFFVEGYSEKSKTLFS